MVSVGFERPCRGARLLEQGGAQTYIQSSLKTSQLAAESPISFYFQDVGVDLGWARRKVASASCHLIW